MHIAVVEALLVSIYLRGNDVYLYIRPTLLPETLQGNSAAFVRFQKASACSPAPDRGRMTEQLGHSRDYASSSFSFAKLAHIAIA